MYSSDILNSSLTTNIAKSKKILAILSKKIAMGYGSITVLTSSEFQVNVKSIQLKKGSANHSKQHTERTTRLLIVILVLFIVAELPQVNDEISWLIFNFHHRDYLAFFRLSLENSSCPNATILLVSSWTFSLLSTALSTFFFSASCLLSSNKL